MRIKLTGETARAYVRELGGSLELAHDSEGLPYFMADDQHPDHEAMLARIGAEAAAIAKATGKEAGAQATKETITITVKGGCVVDVQGIAPGQTLAAPLAGCAPLPKIAPLPGLDPDPRPTMTREEVIDATKYFDESQCGGVFDGHRVQSDAEWNL